jgi:hypothetical protein
MRPEQAGHSTMTGQSFCGHRHDLTPVGCPPIGLPSVFAMISAKKRISHQTAVQIIALIVE